MYTDAENMSRNIKNTFQNAGPINSWGRVRSNSWNTPKSSPDWRQKFGPRGDNIRVAASVVYVPPTMSRTLTHHRTERQVLERPFANGNDIHYADAANFRHVEPVYTPSTSRNSDWNGDENRPVFFLYLSRVSSHHTKSYFSLLISVGLIMGMEWE